MTPRARWLILGSALLGLTFASISSWVHYRLLTDPGYVSPCDLNATVNCTQAYLSRFGSLFGVPVALGGVAWFALVALIAAFARPDGPGSPAPGAAGSYVFGLATIGLAAILYLGYASWFQLKVFCLLCTGTYVAVIAIFVVSGLTSSEAMIRLPLRLAGDAKAILRRPVTLLVALLYVVATGAGVALFPREMKASTAAPPPPAQDVEARFRAAWAQQPRVDLGIAPGTAKVVIVKFNDWLCPACKAWAGAYQPVLDKYEKSDPGAVKYVVKDWPWNSNCNVTVQQAPPPGSGHEASCDAAVAVRIARERSKERLMVDWLFANQESLFNQGQTGKGAQAVEAVRAKAAELLGVTDFGHEYAARLMDIRRDVADGSALQIRSTPTYFINGVRTTTPQTATDPGGQNLPPELFDLGIRIELGKAGGTQ